MEKSSSIDAHFMWKIFFRRFLQQQLFSSSSLSNIYAMIATDLNVANSTAEKLKEWKVIDEMAW